MNKTIEHIPLTNDERRRLKESLFAEKCSCVIRNGDEIRIVGRAFEFESATADDAFEELDI